MAVGVSLTSGKTSDAESQPRVAVFRGLPGIGDLLVAVPALRRLREGLPNARIALIGAEEVEPLMRRFGGLFDEFATFRGWPGLGPQSAEGPGLGPPSAERPGPGRQSAEGPERAQGATAREAAVPVGWLGADAVVQMHGDGTISNAFCAALSPRALITYGPVVSRGCTVDTAPYPRGERELERCMGVAERAVRFFGDECARGDRRLEFPLFAEDWAEAEAVLDEVFGSDEPRAGREYFVMHPGASGEGRRWPEARFAQVARILARRATVLVSGSCGERQVARRTAARAGAGVHSIAGRLSVGGLAALLAGAKGMVTNDTGVSHIADAVGTPSAVVFTASDPHRWAPLDSARHVAVYRMAAAGEEGRVTPEGQRLASPETASVLGALAELGMVS